MEAESNRIKYIPEDRPIDDLRQWYLSGRVVPPNTTVISFRQSLPLPFHLHAVSPYFSYIDSDRIIYLFFLILFINAS